MHFGASEANEFSILFIFGGCFIRFDRRVTFACATERSIWLLVCFRFKKLFTGKKDKRNQNEIRYYCRAICLFPCDARQV